MNNFGILFTAVTLAVVCITNSAANAIDRDYRPAGLEIEDPDYVMDLINKLGRSIIRQNEYQDIVRNPSMTMKRGLDLGLNRGFSGSQAAKHLMGLAAANFAGGPGRRRRSVDRENHFSSASFKAYDSPAEDRQLEKIWR